MLKLIYLLVVALLLLSSCLSGNDLYRKILPKLSVVALKIKWTNV